MQEEMIKKYFDAANAIVISEMFSDSFVSGNDITIDNLKKYNPGHLGTSMSINFILANLYYFLHKENLKSKIIIGTGHAGVSLIANLWLNGTLSNYYDRYSQDKIGLDNLITDFGNTIRSEINPEYPTTIYDGGELGYSLGVAYGYAINSEAQIVPCIIGDGEAETGTITSAWQLAKMLKHKSKVLPIINLNGLKMSSSSFLSKMKSEELNMYFNSLGYQTIIVTANNISITEAISDMQKALLASTKFENPLIIFKSAKGYTLEEFEGNINVHKNPLQGETELEKLKIVSKLLKKYDTSIFDDNGSLLALFKNFRIEDTSEKRKNITDDIDNAKIINLDEYVYNLMCTNNGIVFSPDEIYSNKFFKCSHIAIELLNENLLLALYQGYTAAGNLGYYISYEGFMPILSSMITQYYKYLKQKSLKDFTISKNSLNFILTSTCWENTYSHQNPDFVNALLE